RDAAELKRKANLARGRHAEKLQISDRPLMGGVGTGGVYRNAAVVDGTGAAGGIRFVEARPEGRRAMAVAETPAGVARDAAEIKRRYDLARAAENLQIAERPLMGGVGTGGVYRNTAVVGGAGAASGFPFERLRETAATEATERATREAAEMKRKADLARARHAENLQISERPLMGGVGAGEANRNAKTPGGTDAAGGCRFAVARPEGVRATAVAEVPARAARDAAEVQRKADLARARHAENLQISERPLVSSVGTGEICRDAAVVGGAGAADWFPFIEARPGGLRAPAVAGVAERAARDPAEAKRKTDFAPFLQSEKPQKGGNLLADSVGTDEVYRNAAAVDSTGAGEFPLAGARLDELRAKAAAEVPAKVARDAAEIERKAERARARRAERTRRHGERLERRASRDARRLQKLRDRESRAKSRGERLGPPVEIMERSVRLER
ncbi:unnamed protein product, partial [Laminaria digitata]